MKPYRTALGNVSIGKLVDGRIEGVKPFEPPTDFAFASSGLPEFEWIFDALTLPEATFLGTLTASAQSMRDAFPPPDLRVILKFTYQGEPVQIEATLDGAAAHADAVGELNRAFDKAVREWMEARNDNKESR